MKHSLARRISHLLPESWRSYTTRIFLTAIAPFLKGDRFQCPCCLRNFRRFYTHLKSAPNAMCPGCGSVHRHRLIWLFVQQETDILRKPARLLHVAPEVALARHFKRAQQLDYLSIDLFSPLAMRKMDVQNLDLPDQSYDAIICSHVLDHVDDDRKALREFFRILKPGGWAILQSAVDDSRSVTWEDSNAKTSEQRLQVYGQADLARRYGRDFATRVTSEGFSVDVVNFAERLGSAAVDRYVLDPNDNIYFCRRPA